MVTVQNEVANMKTSTAGGTRYHNVLDSKSIQSIKQFGGDKSTFRTWNDKFINVFTQVRANSRAVFDAMCKHVDREIEEAFEIKHNSEWFKTQGIDQAKFNEYMYVVLM